MLLSRLLLTASAATLISVATVAAQDSQPNTVKQPAAQGGDQPAAKAGAESAGTQGKADDAMPAADGQAADADQPADAKKKKGSQKIEDTAVDSTGDTLTKKQKKAAASDQPAAQDGDQSGAKKKKAQQAGAKTDDMATGTTSRPEITPEKRTVIREKIVTKSVTRIKRNEIDFDINVGVAVPSTFALVTLPSAVVEIVPEYSGYLYFVLDDGTIAIVEPDTMQIVYLLAA